MINNKEVDYMDHPVGYLADCNGQSDDTLGNNHVSCKINE